MSKIYVVDLYEAGICGDKEVAEQYEKQYTDNGEYYIIISEYDCLNK